MDCLPKTNDEDERYTSDDGVFDWFKSFKDIEDYFGTLISDKSASILMLGCGNSTLSEEMYEAGYTNIVNIDYSAVVIEKMKLRNEDRPLMRWLEMDVRNLVFDDASFDVAIDKGTMDAMLAVKGDVWNPPKSAVDDCNREVDEVIRVLKDRGVFLYLTFGQPHFRKKYLLREKTSLDILTLGETFHYFLYVLRREV
ncbi:hypothetical protein FRC14_001428 [Serendipita sp. 396]|nr:hypothetical protein FRC14_001428 [Serendipita sp. 396]KAG8788880.1 hypothetical protein FRC15_001395 [Serendipita sp. 397]